MSTADKLAEAARNTIFDCRKGLPFSMCSLEDALAAYDAAKSVREAALDVVQKALWYSTWKYDGSPKSAEISVDHRIHLGDSVMAYIAACKALEGKANP